MTSGASRCECGALVGHWKPCSKASPELQQRWRDDDAHLRDDAPYQVCDGCGRKSWAAVRTASCGMPQLDGSRCTGTFHDPSGARVRDPACVERWPECEEGAYHPDCCRFPKSCSCTVYEPPASSGAKQAERSVEDDYLVRTALQLADDHRERCPGAACTVTLTSLAVLLQRAGIHLTPGEYGRLL